MRQLTDHIANPVNEALKIFVVDEPGQGGACHEYHVEATTAGAIPPYASATMIDGKACPSFGACDVHFQNGPIKEFGVNGITQEALLAIVIDRLRSFQNGDFKCRENAIALTHCEDALLWLQKRTRDRLARGVEGTNEK